MTTVKQSALITSAYEMWTIGGSMGLGLWLANHKERTTGKRFYTVEEIGEWVRLCIEMDEREGERLTQPQGIAALTGQQTTQHNTGA